MSGLFRQTDAVLTIMQDNRRHVVEVTAANEVAGEVLGYSLDELKGMDFHRIVTPKVGEMIDDYVEYEDGANDVAAVLRKVRDFQLKNKAGDEASYNLKIVHHHSYENDNEYLLIVQDAAKHKETDAFLEMLRENVSGHEAIRPETGLPDGASLMKGLELVSYHIDHVSNGATVALLQVDNYEEVLSKHGVQVCHEVIKNVANLCRQNLRTNDVIAQPKKDQVGLILIGASDDPAKIVLNRLRWLVSSMQTQADPKTSVSCTVSVVFHTIENGQAASDMLEHCNAALENKAEKNTNLVIQV